MPKLDDQIATLQDKLGQLKLRQQRIDARKRAIEETRERKLQTRRRLLIGTIVMTKAQSGEFDPATLRGWLDQSLTRDDDRTLFHLPTRADV